MKKEKETKVQEKSINVETKAPTEKEFTKAIEKSVMNPKSKTQHNEFYDSTSMVQLTVMRENFDPLITSEVKITDKIDQAIDSITKSQKVHSESLDERVNMIKEAYINVSNAEKAVTAGLTGLYVKIGKLLLDTKKIIALDSEKEWGDWSDNNLGFMSRRTMQTYMQLAQIPNVEKYIFFGKERLIHTWQVTKPIMDQNDPDPIGTLLQKHDIDFEKATEIPLVEFKNMVDAAVIIEKTSRKNLDLDRESVRGLIEMGFKFTNTDYKEFKQIKEAKGDPNKLLDKLFINKGKREEVYEQPDKKKASFIRATAQMKKLVDQMIENKKFENIDHNEITALIKKLEDFKEKVINQ